MTGGSRKRRSPSWRRPSPRCFRMPAGSDRQASKALAAVDAVGVVGLEALVGFHRAAAALDLRRPHGGGHIVAEDLADRRQTPRLVQQVVAFGHRRNETK